MTILLISLKFEAIHICIYLCVYRYCTHKFICKSI